jgi:hypothetical protein
MVGRVVDRRGPRPPQPESADGWKELFDAVARLAVVDRVEVDGDARWFVGVAHAPQQAAGFAWPPINPGRHVEHHRQLVHVERQRRGHHHLMPGAAGGNSASRRRPHLCELRAAGQHHVFGVDRAVGGVHPDDTAARDPQPGEAAAFADIDTDCGQCGGVCQHVARRVDVSVARRIGCSQRDARRQARLARVDVRGRQPLHLEAQRPL